MDILHSRCCGLDVHKKTIAACVLRLEGKTKNRQQRTFGTMTRDLLSLSDWLKECGVTHVAMESSGVYWKPVWNILEGSFEVILVNAQHIKAVPGRKTDQKDSEWIADLLQHGLLRSSFVPPTLTRELRDLTRYRVNLVQECNRIANRIQKVLEDANIKLAAVVSDSLGASGRAMLKAIIQGEQDAEKLSEMSKGTLRNKRDELKLAMEGRITTHHRFLLKELFDHLEFVEGKIERLEAEISQRMHPFEEKVQHLRTIPGIDRITAWGLLAEIGMDMNRFPDAAHLASWAGLCPGNHESAGKRMSGKTRKGSVWLTRHLCQAAWAVSTKKNSYLSALFRRVAARRGVKRAIIAIAHTILVIVFHMLKRGIDYRDLGPNYFDRLNAEQVKRNLVKRLENLGLRVTLDTRPQEA